METYQTDKNILENRQALFDLLDAEVKTNVGRIPVPDYLDLKASRYGYDSYEELYRDGCRLEGYEKISPKVIEEWRDQKKKDRPSLKERLAKEQEKTLLYGDKRMDLRHDRDLPEV